MRRTNPSRSRDFGNTTPGAFTFTCMNEQKLCFVNFLLPACPFMQVNVKAPGVVLPKVLLREGLVLRIGMDPSVLGMPDLQMDVRGWSATLSIQGARHFAVIPWEAVTRMWLEHGPLVAWLQQEHEEEEAAKLLLSGDAPVAPLKEDKPGLRLVKS